jgi:hypothetical protein
MSDAHLLGRENIGTPPERIYSTSTFLFDLRDLFGRIAPQIMYHIFFTKNSRLLLLIL